MNIVALTGQAGAGKDTFADVLVEKFGFVKRGFADPIYEEVAAAFNVGVEWLKDRAVKEEPQDLLRIARCADEGFVARMRWKGYDVLEARSPRWILQRWGTEYRREMNARYWIDRMTLFVFDRKFADEDPPAGVVIPDMRFENEAEWVLANDGYVVEIRRPGLAAVEGTHASARPLHPRYVKKVVTNSGSLHDLRSVAICTMKWLLDRAVSVSA